MHSNGRRSDKPFTEYFVVPNPNLAVRETGNRDDLDLQVGEVGIVTTYSHPNLATPLRSGDFLPAGTTSRDVPNIQIIWGTTGDPTNAWTNWKLENPMETPEIIKCQINSVSCAVLPPSRSINFFKDFCPIECDCNYTINIIQEGQRLKNRTGNHNRDVTLAQFATTGCCDTCIEAPTDPLSYLLHNLIYNVNLNSTAVTWQTDGARPQGTGNFIGLGINCAGGAGTPIANIVLGDVIDVMVVDGQTVTIEADAALIQALHDAQNVTTLPQCANGEPCLCPTATIEVIDLCNAENGAVTIDSMMFVGLNESRSCGYSGIFRDDVKLKVELGGCFANSAKTPTKCVLAGNRASRTKGSIGELWYEIRAYGQDGGLDLAGHSDTLIKNVSQLDPNKDYKFCSIDTHRKDNHNNDYHHVNQRIWIAQEIEIDAASSVATGVTYNPVGTFDFSTTLGAWIADQDYCDECAEFIGDSTMTVPLA